MLLLAFTNIYAQNSIKGTVVDANTKQGLVFANLYFPDIERGTSTDENGSFSIQNLPSGNYKILISLLGYETKSVTISIPIANKIEVSLVPSAIEMEAIIV